MNFLAEDLYYPGGDTNTTGGLEMALQRMYGQSGDRRDIKNVVVLITDGIPTYPEPEPRLVEALGIPWHGEA